MTKEELFALTFEQQEIWADHATDPADNQIFCYIIHLDEGRLEDMIDNPADYDVGNEIQQMDSTISDDRVKQINSGAELTAWERKSLEQFLLELQNQDEEGLEGQNFVGRKVRCDDGEICAVYTGYSQGPSTELEFYSLYENEEDCIKSLQIDLEPQQRIYLI